MFFGPEDEVYKKALGRLSPVGSVPVISGVCLTISETMFSTLVTALSIPKEKLRKKHLNRIKVINRKFIVIYEDIMLTKDEDSARTNHKENINERVVNENGITKQDFGGSSSHKLKYDLIWYCGK